jgi:hypothetical protein
VKPRRCVHCGKVAALDRAGWCRDCQRRLAVGQQEFRHLDPRPVPSLQAALVLARCRFRQELAAVVGETRGYHAIQAS